MSIWLRASLVGLSILGATLALAQSTARSPELERLSVFVGTWWVDGQVFGSGSQPSMTTGTTEVEWTLNGQWLRLTSRESAHAHPDYAVTVFITWNDQEREYKAAVVSTALQAPIQYSGRWVGERRLEFTGVASGKFLQRVAYELRGQYEIAFEAANSSDGGATYVPHAVAIWRAERDAGGRHRGA